MFYPVSEKYQYNFASLFWLTEKVQGIAPSQVSDLSSCLARMLSFFRYLDFDEQQASNRSVKMLVEFLDVILL